MATTVTLAYSSTTVTLPAPDYPEEPGTVLQQSISQSMSGRVMSVTRNAGVITTPPYPFKLTESAYNSLVSFIQTTVSGATTVFTYTDHDSTAWNATYLSGIPGKQVAFDDWAVDLKMRLVVP